MATWHLFTDSLDSNGGHIVILLLLIVAGIVISKLGIMQGEALTTGAFGALLFKMKDTGSNLDARIKSQNNLTIDK